MYTKKHKTKVKICLFTSAYVQDSADSQIYIESISKRLSSLCFAVVKKWVACFFFFFLTGITCDSSN